MPISLEDYLSVPHVLTSLTDDAHGAVDEALAKHKLKRTIALTTPGFLAVPFVVRRAPVITTMPSRLARYFAEAFGLATSPAPIELPTFTISLLWHASFDHDPGHVWLRQTVVGPCLRGRFGALSEPLPMWTTSIWRPVSTRIVSLLPPNRFAKRGLARRTDQPG